jgi:hypothetical protein
MIGRCAEPKRGHFRSARVCLLATLLLLGACARSPSDRLAQYVKTAGSAVATAQMTLEAWLAGDVPGHYARRALQAMREQLDAAGRSLADADQIPAAQRTVLREALAQTSAAIGRAQAAVAASDRGGAATARQDVRAAASALSAALRTARGQR